MGPMTQTIIIASTVLPDRQPGDCAVVRTPLDLIQVLDARPEVGTVILADAFAQSGVRDFLRDEYPTLRIVSMESPRQSHRAHAAYDASLLVD